jgi:carbon-monoxide dehydrogenase medium subunit
VIPAAFDYQRASSAEEAIALLGEHGDEAKLLAGGHSLLPLMKLRLATPAMLIDVGRVTDLSYITDAGDHVAIGALTRHRALETSDVLEQHAPLLKHAASYVGDPQVRHRGTLGGTLAHGDPASDLPAVVLALGGSLVAKGPNGERTIAATDFFQGFLETSLQPDELVTEVRIPKHTGRGWSFQKFNRRAQDWAIVGVAAVRTDGGANVALVNMGSTPVRASAVEDALQAGTATADAAALAAEGLDPPADLNASPEYRRHLATVLVGRALQEGGLGPTAGGRSSSAAARRRSRPSPAAPVSPAGPDAAPCTRRVCSRRTATRRRRSTRGAGPPFASARSVRSTWVASSATPSPPPPAWPTTNGCPSSTPSTAGATTSATRSSPSASRTSWPRPASGRRSSAPTAARRRTGTRGEAASTLTPCCSTS